MPGVKNLGQKQLSIMSQAHSTFGKNFKGFFRKNCTTNGKKLQQNTMKNIPEAKCLRFSYRIPILQLPQVC